MVEVDRSQAAGLRADIGLQRGLKSTTLLTEQDRNRIAGVSNDSSIHLSKIRNTIVVEVRRDDLVGNRAVGWNGWSDIDERAVTFPQHHGHGICIDIRRNVIRLAVMIEVSRKDGTW